MTVGAIVERVYRTYLYPPDSRPAQALVSTAINTTDTALILKNFVIPEDEEMMKNGIQLEIGSELLQVIAYDELVTTATVQRAAGGTTAASHDVDDLVTLSPPFTRLSVFAAVADNILTLYPKLYTVTTGSVVTVAAGISALDDVLAVEVVEAWPDGLSSAQEVDARIVDFHPTTGGRSLVTNIRVGQIWVKFRRRFGDAADETATLASLGMEERWINIVMAGAAGDLMAGRDIPAAHTEWVAAVLEAENIPVGTRSSVARNLAAYRTYLLDNAAKEMRAEYKAKTHMRPSGQVLTRSAWGG